MALWKTIIVLFPLATVAMAQQFAVPALSADLDIRQAWRHDVSLPLSDLMQSLPLNAGIAASLSSMTPVLVEPLVVGALQASPGPPNPFQLVRNFDGIKTADSPFIEDLAVDATGAVGPHHYVQSVNFATAVYNKHGTRILGPQDSGVYWAGFGGACSTGHWSDEVVLYDRALTAGWSAASRGT